VRVPGGAGGTRVSTTGGSKRWRRKPRTSASAAVSAHRDDRRPRPRAGGGSCSSVPGLVSQLRCDSRARARATASDRVSRLALISPWPSKLLNDVCVGWMIGVETTVPLKSMPNSWWKFS
jgi:hypothetical protein